MFYNLLIDQWVPIQLGNLSQSTKIAPEKISDRHWQTLVAPRADLKGALFQFLIGLLQTTFAPEDREQWEKYWQSPPSEQTLKKAFAPYHDAFYLNAENKPAFMQDFDLAEGELKSVATLLIESPGVKTLKDNQDHFIKRGVVNQMSPYWAALSLFTLQINAPSGGVGHRVGIRGGGPMTTLLIPPLDQLTDTLWHKLWLNILTKEEMEPFCLDSELTENKYIFPWLSETRTSEKKGMETLPVHANPLQMYWPMPRRIRLDWNAHQNGNCDISGEYSENIVTHFLTKNYGINYEGYWQHPLSAYVVTPERVPNSVKTQSGGLSYRYWMGLVHEDTKKYRQPALIVSSYKEWRCESINGTNQAQLWAFGYDMDNMKARCWYEATMPVFHIPKQQLNELGFQLPKMIEAASDALKTLKQSLKMAWFKRPKDANGDISFIDHSFWEQTESSFYQQLRVLINQLDDNDAIQAILAEWKSSLHDYAVKIFDDYVLSSLNQDGEMKRIVLARENLNKWLKYSKAMKALKVA